MWQQTHVFPFKLDAEMCTFKHTFFIHSTKGEWMNKELIILEFASAPIQFNSIQFEFKIDCDTLNTIWFWYANRFLSTGFHWHCFFCLRIDNTRNQNLDEKKLWIYHWLWIYFEDQIKWWFSHHEIPEKYSTWIQRIKFFFSSKITGIFIELR